MPKTKYNYELLNTLCNTELLNDDYSNQKLTRDTYIEGKCITENCQNNFRRTFRYLYEIWIYNSKGEKINCIV